VRFGASGYAKELFPLLFTTDAEDRLLEPRPICELALRAIRAAGARRCVVMVSSEKAEVLRVLAHGGGLDLSLAYLVQPEPLGLPHALRCAAPWLGDADVVFALPDTIVLPSNALQEVEERRVRAGADLALGVFPVEEPERLGPVEVGPEGDVDRILDKPGHRAVMNSWGVASWSATFTRFCAEWDEKGTAGPGRERALGHAFEAARQAGLRVVARRFESGLFLDIGTPSGLRRALQVLGEHGVLEQVQAALGVSTGGG